MPDAKILVIAALGGLLWFGAVKVEHGAKKAARKAACALKHGAAACRDAKPPLGSASLGNARDRRDRPKPVKSTKPQGG